MKSIRADKVKDGWYVVIRETKILYTKEDVLKFIKQNNLEVKKEFSNEERIIAE